MVKIGGNRPLLLQCTRVKLLYSADRRESTCLIAIVP